MIQSMFATWFPQYFGGKGQPRSLMLVNPLPENDTVVIDGDALADFLPRKVIVGTTGIVHFKGVIKFVQGKGHNLDHASMVVHHLDEPRNAKAKANKVRLTGNVLVHKDVLPNEVDVVINEMTFAVLTNGDIVLLPISGVSEARDMNPAPKPRALK